MKKWGIRLLIIAIAVVGGLSVFYYIWQQQQFSRITSYEECVKAGLPVMESYPPRCRVPNGKIFTQYIGNELEHSEDIIVSYPRPNQQIKSPLVIEGKARGGWFFEGSFSVELYDEKNVSLGQAVLQAKEEWMTEEFVTFEGELTFDKKNASKGELRIRNANPSGMKENEKVLLIPVVF